MKYKLDPSEIRVYYTDSSCIFKRNNEKHGGLSNMATGFPLKINGIEIKTTEALYQACRFPHFSDIQQKIIEQKSPMQVKMISNSNKKKSRKDWEVIRIKVMKWAINVKLAQNFISFGTVLHETGLRNIVENSSSDNFWGAIPNEDQSIFTGKNALGRLLMDLRQTFYSKDNFWLLYVEPPQIDNFTLYNEPIGLIDERQNFINLLQNYWKMSSKNLLDVNSSLRVLDSNEDEFLNTGEQSIFKVKEENSLYKLKKVPNKKGRTKKKVNEESTQTNLFKDTQ